MSLFKKVLWDTASSLVTVAAIMLAVLVAHGSNFPIWGWAGSIAFALVMSFLYQLNSHEWKSSEDDKEAQP